MDPLGVFSYLWVVRVPLIKVIFMFKLFKFLRTYACVFSGSFSGEGPWNPDQLVRQQRTWKTQRSEELPVSCVFLTTKLIVFWGSWTLDFLRQLKSLKGKGRYKRKY